MTNIHTLHKDEIFQIIKNLNDNLAYSYSHNNYQFQIDNTSSFEISTLNKQAHAQAQSLSLSYSQIQSPIQHQSQSSPLQTQYNSKLKSKSKPKEKEKYKKEDFPKYTFINKLSLIKKVDSQLVERINYFFSECKILLSDKEFSNIIEYILNFSEDDLIFKIGREIEGYSYLYHKYNTLIS